MIIGGNSKTSEPTTRKLEHVYDKEGKEKKTYDRRPLRLLVLSRLRTSTSAATADDYLFDFDVRAQRIPLSRSQLNIDFVLQHITHGLH